MNEKFGKRSSMLKNIGAISLAALLGLQPAKANDNSNDWGEKTVVQKIDINRILPPDEKENLKYKYQVKEAVEKLEKEFGVKVVWDFDKQTSYDRFGRKIELVGLQNFGQILKVVEKINMYMYVLPPDQISNRLSSIHIGINLSITRQSDKNYVAGYSDELGSIYLNAGEFVSRVDPYFFEPNEFHIYFFHEIGHLLFPQGIINKKIWMREVIGQLQKMGYSLDEIKSFGYAFDYTIEHKKPVAFTIQKPNYGFARVYGRDNFLEDICTTLEQLLDPKFQKKINTMEDRLFKAKILATRAILDQMLDLPLDFWEKLGELTIYNGENINTEQTKKKWKNYWLKLGRLAQVSHPVKP